MVYQAVATVLYLTAFLANAASVRPFYLSYFYGHMAAAAVRNLTPRTLTQTQRNAYMCKKHGEIPPSENMFAKTNPREKKHLFGQLTKIGAWTVIHSYVHLVI